MKRISLFIAALALGLFATTAATCQKTDPNSPITPIVGGVVNCAEQGVHNAAIHILDDVASALATGDYVSGLIALVKQFGEGAVDCAASEIADTAGKHAAMDELEATKAKRAKAWLASRPVTVSEDREFPGAVYQRRGSKMAWTRPPEAPVYLAGICFCP